MTLFKTLLFIRLNLPWSIILGTYFQFSPVSPTEHIPNLLLFSVLQVMAFLFKLWTVYLLVRLITPPFHTTRATETLAFFARPFSRISPFAQPFVLIALHAALAFAVSRTGVLHLLTQVTEAPKPAAVSPFLDGPYYVQLLRLGWLAALSLADGLALLVRMLFALIIGNLVAALLQARGAMLVCSEGVELLLGRFSRHGAGGMGFDFTPLIFFFVVDLMYNSVCRGLFELIHSPLLR